MIKNFIKWISGNDEELFLSERWMNDEMRRHEDWTRRQLDQGCVTKGPKESAHAQFWKRIAEKEQQTKTLRFPIDNFKKAR